MNFDITVQDIAQTKSTLLVSSEPLVFKVFPKKEKRKYILLCMLVHKFENNLTYKESEVNDVIRPVYDDFATVRRYLVDYKFLKRSDDCKSYWLNVDKNDYNDFI